MTPKNRERAYDKRRYEEWQSRLAEKQAHTRKVRQRLAVGGGSIVVVLVILAAFLLANEGKDDDSTSAASSTPAASASAVATTAATDAKSSCPTVDVKAPENPQTFDKAPDKSLAGNKTWTWTLKTTCGTITIDLDGKKAPQAVSAMIQLTQAKFFDGLSCHRLTTSGIFVLQCGDPAGDGTGGPGYTFGPVENAPADKVYKAGTVAMARGNSEDSQGSQFFLVYQDSSIGGDYTVLGQITKGLDVVKKVAVGGSNNASGDGAPNSAVSIKTATVSG